MNKSEEAILRKLRSPDLAGCSRPLLPHEPKGFIVNARVMPSRTPVLNSSKVTQQEDGVENPSRILSLTPATSPDDRAPSP